MADKDNENLDATTAENVDAKETVSEEPSTDRYISRSIRIV